MTCATEPRPGFVSASLAFAWQGTAVFGGTNAMLGLTPSPGGDLESLTYALIQAFGAVLPWEHAAQLLGLYDDFAPEQLLMFRGDCRILWLMGTGPRVKVPAYHPVPAQQLVVLNTVHWHLPSACRS